MATKSPTQHHNHWHTFASAAQLPNVSGASVQDAALEVGDLAYVTGSGTYECTNATLGSATWTQIGGGVGAITGSMDAPSERVLWAWNQTDLSQFTGPQDYGTPNGTLSVAPYPAGLDVPQRNRIVYTQPGDTPISGRIWWVNDLPTMPDAYIVEATLGPREAGALGPNTDAEIIIMGQDTSHLIQAGHGGSPFTAFNLVVANGTTFNVGGHWVNLVVGLLDNVDEGYRIRVLVDLRDPTGSTDPGASIYAGRPVNGIVRASSAGWAAFGAPGPSPAVAWDAGWRTGGTAKRIGMSFAAQVAAAGQAYLADLRVLEPLFQNSVAASGSAVSEFDWAVDYTYSQLAVPVEATIGYGLLDGSLVGGTAKFRASWDPQFTVPGTASVRLYDVGPAAGPPTAPVLIATLSATASGLVYDEQALTVGASPGAGQIANSARIYMVAVYQSSQAGDSVFVGNAGITLN